MKRIKWVRIVSVDVPYDYNSLRDEGGIPWFRVFRGLLLAAASERTQIIGICLGYLIGDQFARFVFRERIRVLRLYNLCVSLRTKLINYV